MKIKKRKKSSRFRGSHTHGRGGKKKARGSGHRGGVGMAGTGKRADQRKSYVLNLYGKDYFGKDKALRRGKKKEVKTISLEEINDNITSFIKGGVAKENHGLYEIDLREYKIIGNNPVSLKLKINALAASKSAQETIKKTGGEIVILTNKGRKVKIKKENQGKEE